MSITIAFPNLQLSPGTGVEADTCFYIQNAEVVRNCTHLDLTQFPPPDLAIECDVTSKTVINAYRTVKVPEVWIYEGGELQIYLYYSDRYEKTLRSLAFPDFPISEMIPYLLQIALTQGTRQMLGELKANYFEAG
jgi:Uma2 family endonuclease